MKKIILNLSLPAILFIMGLNLASAQYYNYNTNYNTNTYGNYGNNSSNYTPYYNTYANAPTSNSYQFTQGCYIYNYDRYTRITSLLGSNCNVNNNNTYSYNTGYNNYNNTYNYGYNTSYNSGYVQPTYTNTYTYPTQNTYPYNNYNNNQYSTYRYVNGVWVPGNTNTYQNNGCTYMTYPYQACY